VHLAIIPAHAEASLADRLSYSPHFFAMVHGWAHENHSPPETKKAEFGTPRRAAKPELERAMARMREIFGTGLLPVFVPPWNRLHTDHLALLAPAGYRGLSAFGARPARHPCPGLLAVNTHVDPVDWKGTRGLISPAHLIPRVAELLRDRREGRTDPEEPFGYLTHHLVHDTDLWHFSETFLKEMLDGGARPQDIGQLLESMT
jgi:hypothetical protein